MTFETPGADRALAICVYLPSSQENELEAAIATLQQDQPLLESSDAPDLIFAAGLKTVLSNHATRKETIMTDLFITVPETTLPSGLIVAPFRVGRYLASKGADGKAVVTADGAPWVNINYHDAMQAINDAGFLPFTETQALALAWNASQQDINWTGGKVGEGKMYQGLHKWNLDSAQAGTYESEDPEERRWLQLSNGERIYDLAGNAYSWIYDNIQGDAAGLTTTFKADSPSLTTAPYPSREKGMGWRPTGECDWSGYALVRGGCWRSESLAGVFRLGYGWPDGASGNVGFRCTLPGL